MHSATAVLNTGHRLSSILEERSTTIDGVNAVVLSGTRQAHAVPVLALDRKRPRPPFPDCQTKSPRGTTLKDLNAKRAF